VRLRSSILESATRAVRWPIDILIHKRPRVGPERLFDNPLHIPMVASCAFSIGRTLESRARLWKKTDDKNRSSVPRGGTKEG
jgi:hypothetical protein